MSQHNKDAPLPGGLELSPAQLRDGRTRTRLGALVRLKERPPRVGKVEWMKRVARETGIGFSTLSRWAREERQGKAAGARAPLRVAVSSRAGAVGVALRSSSFTPAAIEYGISLLMRNPRLGIRDSYLELSNKAAQAGWEIGSEASWYRVVRQVPPAVRSVATGGRRALEALVTPPVLRDFSAYHVHEMLVGDQHIFDYIVLDDDGNPVRPEIFAWGDFRSRYFSGLWPVLGPYDKWSVGFALREACRWGIPKNLYNDNGKPERSHYMATLRQQLSGYTAFRRWGKDDVGQHFARPRNAQAKPIESWFFHAVERPLMQKDIPGYARRDGDEKTNDMIQELLRDATRKKKLWHFRDFFEVFLGVLDRWHRHRMSEAGIVPREEFLAGIAEAPLVRLTDRTLDFLIFPSESRLVRDSSVRLKLPGWGVCTWYAPELSALCARGRRQRVEVKYNPYDPATAYVLDKESSELICIAERWEKIDPKDGTALGRKIRRQRQLIGWWMEIAADLSSRAEAKPVKLSPYTAAAQAAATQKRLKEDAAIDRAALQARLIELAQAAREA